MSALRWVPLGVFFFLMALFAAALFMERTEEGSLALVGEPAPEFVLSALPPQEGAGLAHADLLGGRISIVNVWASWCAPCRVEHPQLVELSHDPACCCMRRSC